MVVGDCAFGVVKESFPDLSVVDPVVVIILGLAWTVDVQFSELIICSAVDKEVSVSAVVISGELVEMFALGLVDGAI